MSVALSGYFEVVFVVLRLFEGCFEVVWKCCFEVVLSVVLRLFESCFEVVLSVV